MASRTTRVALGFQAHTGWAALVAASGPASAPAIHHRERLEMIAGKTLAEPRFVYHVAAELSLAEAGKLVRASQTRARTAAKKAIATVIRELGERGLEVVAAGVVDSNKLLLATLEEILGAHALLHAAEGVLFRQALIEASEACKLSVTTVSAGELRGRGAQLMRLTDQQLDARLVAIGKQAGRPWAKNQKDALLVALLALEAA